MNSMSSLRIDWALSTASHGSLIFIGVLRIYNVLYFLLLEDLSIFLIVFSGLLSAKWAVVHNTIEPALEVLCSSKLNFQFLEVNFQNERTVSYSDAPCALSIHQCQGRGRACAGDLPDSFQRSSETPCVRRDHSDGPTRGPDNPQGTPRVPVDRDARSISRGRRTFHSSPRAGAGNLDTQSAAHAATAGPDARGWASHECTEADSP